MYGMRLSSGFQENSHNEGGSGRAPPARAVCSNVDTRLVDVLENDPPESKLRTYYISLGIVWISIVTSLVNTLRVYFM